jgi:hypothetical protein
MNYLNPVLGDNRAQFRLYHAIGWPPLPTAGASPASPGVQPVYPARGLRR